MQHKKIYSKYLHMIPQNFLFFNSKIPSNTKKSKGKYDTMLEKA